MSATISATRRARTGCGCGCGCRSCAQSGGGSLGLSELEYELEAELESELEFETESEVIGRDTRVPVPNTRVAPFRYICHFVVDRDTPWCSGILIAPNVVLTAAHCMFDFRSSPGRLTVIPGRNGLARPFGTARVTRLNFARGYRGPSDHVTARDYGVVYLAQPIGLRVGHWSIAHTSSRIDPLGTSISDTAINNGQQLHISGYPADKVFTAGTPPQRVVQQWRSQNILRTIDEFGMMHYLNDTFGGHSGSPIWIERPASLGGHVMVGVHTGGDDRGRRDATTPRLIANRGLKFTPEILNDIRQKIRQAPPVPRPPVRPPARPIVRILDRFQFDRPGVQPHHRPVIDEMARIVAGTAGTPSAIHTIRIVGHADSSGSDQYNLNLGQQRAVSVQQELVAAIDKLRPGHSRTLTIIPQSLGESKPIADNTTADGRARNRRVEVTLIGR
jgi:outer membrane protein OmpA-like peptidoglycan-associated protein